VSWPGPSRVPRPFLSKSAVVGRSAMEAAARASVAGGARCRGAFRLVGVTNNTLSHSPHLHIVCEQPLTPRARAGGRQGTSKRVKASRKEEGGARGRVLLIGHLLLREQRVSYRALPPVYSSPVVCVWVGWWLRSSGDHECRCDVRQSDVLLLACLSQSNAPTQVVRDIHVRTRWDDRDKCGASSRQLFGVQTTPWRRSRPS
jgi:hypothetical protein